MREAIAALEAALRELDQARPELPEDMGAELTVIIEETRRLLEALRANTATGADASS